MLDNANGCEYTGIYRKTFNQIDMSKSVSSNVGGSILFAKDVNGNRISTIGASYYTDKSRVTSIYTSTRSDTNNCQITLRI